MQREAFIDTEEKLIAVLQRGATAEQAANPAGTRFIIEAVRAPSEKPTVSRALAMPAAHINRSSPMALRCS